MHALAYLPERWAKKSMYLLLVRDGEKVVLRQKIPSRGHAVWPFEA